MNFRKMLLSVAIVPTLFLFVCLFGCSGGAPQKDTSDASDSLDMASADTVTVEGPEGATDTEGDAASVENYAVSDVSTDAGSDCGGKVCDSGQQCIEYVGYAGNKLFTCGIPCVADAPNDGCPEDMHCQVIPDGPTQCVK